ncbi:hypothetical protein D3C75_985570 [compost metagenome]
MQSLGIGAAAIGCQVGGSLSLERWHKAQLVDQINSHARTASGVVVAGLAVAVGAGIGAVVVGDLLRPDPARIGGELAGDGADELRQERPEVARVAEAVSDEDRAAVGVLRQGGGRHCAEKAINRQRLRFTLNGIENS